MRKLFVGIACAEPARGRAFLHADVDEAVGEIDGEGRLVCVAGVLAADLDGEEIAYLFDWCFDAVVSRQQIEIIAAEERDEWSADFRQLEELSCDTARLVRWIPASPTTQAAQVALRARVDAAEADKQQRKCDQVFTFHQNVPFIEIKSH